MEEGSVRADPARGRFIVIEGVDGSGKSTQAKRLYDRLRNEAPFRAAALTAQPSQGPVGKLLRQYLREEIPHRELGWRAAALLFAADRQDHLDHVIEPALRQGLDVVCDRYVPSTLVYQGAHAASIREQLWLEELNRDFRVPDLMIVLELTPDQARARLEQRARRDLFENDQLLAKLVRGYENLPHQRGRVVYVDGSCRADSIADHIWDIVRDLPCAL